MLSFTILSALCCCASSGAAIVLESRCETLELNHHYDSQTGRRVFTQWIGWGPVEDDGHSHIIWWRLTRKKSYPIKRGGGYSLVWLENGTIVLIRAKTFSETWTTYDIELIHRERFRSQDKRAGLIPKAQPP